MNMQPLTVSELNAHIKRLLDGDQLLGSLAVRGELSNYKVYSSGHHYFTLKDAESSLKCVMFRSSASRIRFRPENGMGVTAVGSVSVYQRDGVYQLYCTELIPTGMGDLYLAFEQLKARLSKEGLFDPEHKKPIPAFPKRIAVITSGSGAAVRDIIRVLGHRWPDAQVVILPVRVQGAEAPPEIVGAIRYANRYQVGDLIITGRGGGSMEDLWAFNDERVARAIYESDLPVISAVGHEPDITIADFVADLRAATPSNAAELAVPDQADVREALTGLQSRLEYSIRRELVQNANRLKDLTARKVLSSPTAYLDFKRMELDRLQGKMITVSEGWLAARRQQFGQTAAALDAMSPLKVLARGYTVATNEKGMIIRSTADAKDGDKLRLRVTDGNLFCRVESDGSESGD